jgi:hypothetical protein
MRCYFLKRVYFIIIILTAVLCTCLAQVKNADLVGAWQTGKDTITTRIFTEHFFVYTSYNVVNKQFFSTAGGRWKIDQGILSETYEFHSRLPKVVGKIINTPFELANEKKQFTTGKQDLLNFSPKTWNKLDDGAPGRLAGAWLFVGRMNDGVITKVTPGAQRTMKILSGTRFQWVAYNTETKEFYGTGGGNYTTEFGKYTEKIEFFSRDNSRVGGSLQFDYSIEAGNWHHQGLSSKGIAMHEIWTKREKTGL